MVALDKSQASSDKSQQLRRPFHASWVGDELPARQITETLGRDKVVAGQPAFTSDRTDSMSLKLEL